MKFSENEQPKKELKKLNHEVEQFEGEVEKEVDEIKGDIEEIDEKIGLKTEKVAEKSAAKIEKVDQKVEGVKSDIKEIKSDVRDLSKATKTLFKIFTRSHDYLLNHYIWYYNWHTNKASSPTHWAALVLTIILLVYVFGFQLGFFGGQKPVVSAGAGINKMINYQGKLTDNSDIPVPDASYNMKFSIYTDSGGTTRVWTCAGTLITPTAISVTVANGIFSVGLGATGDCTNALDLDFNTDEYYLGVTVGADAEMTPRKRIGAVGYAYNADAVDGIHAATTATANELLALDAGKAIIDISGLTLANGASRTIDVAAAASGNNGDDLTVQAGNATHATNPYNGGNLVLQSGNKAVGGGNNGAIIFNIGTANELARFDGDGLYFVSGIDHTVAVADGGGDQTGAKITLQGGNAGAPSVGNGLDGGGATIVGGNGSNGFAAGATDGGDGASVYIYGGAGGLGFGGGANGADGDVILAHTGVALQGNVGIGDTTPAALLTVGDGDLFQVAGATGSVTINNAGDTGSVSIEGTILDINSLDFVGAGSISTAAGQTLTVDSGTTGAINLGTAAAAKTITIGNETSTSSLELDSGTGAINIGNAIAKTITIGNITGATAVNLNTGTGGSTITTTGAGDFTVSSGDQVIINSSKAAGGTTTEAISIKSTVNMGATDEVLQIGDTADMMTILGNGNVGIGTATPSGPLDVSSSSAGADETPYRTVGGAIVSGAGDYNLGYKFTVNASGQITALAARVHDTNSNTIRLYDSGGTVLASAIVTGVVDTWVSASITPVSVTAGSWYVVAVRTSNYTYSAGHSLPIAATSTITINEGRYLAATNNVPTTSSTANIYGADITFVKGPEIMLVANDGKVGIGTSPIYPLHVYTTTVSTRAGYFYQHAGAGDNIGVYGDSDGSSANSNTGIYGRAHNGSWNYGAIFYATGPDGSANYGLYATASGGAGSTSWAGYFSGNVWVSGYVDADYYQEHHTVKEAIAEEGGLTKGELVYISGEGVDLGREINTPGKDSETKYSGIKTPKVSQSVKAYDHRVVGVVVQDEDPGAITVAGQKIKVTISGAYPVLVDASYGAIKPGDPIASSDHAGYGMKATQAGPILGYALESLESGTGQVTVWFALSWYEPTAGENLQGSDQISALKIISPDDQDLVIESGSGKTKIIGQLEVTDKLIIVSDIEIKGHIVGSHDTRGMITISAGATEAEFVFDTPYLFEPSVVATQKITCSEKAEGKVCGAMIDGGYAVEVYQDKFIIHIAKELDYDVTFNWSAEQ